MGSLQMVSLSLCRRFEVRFVSNRKVIEVFFPVKDRKVIEIFFTVKDRKGSW